MQIRFASLLPVWLIIAIAIVGSTVIILWYWRESRQIRSSWGKILALLRGIAFCLLIAMLLRPTLEYAWTQGELSRLRILIDTSTSMRTLDEPSMRNPSELVTRIERVKQGLLNESIGRASLLDRLARQHRVEVVDLEGRVLWDSNQTKPPSIDWEIVADRPRTPLGETLLTQIREAMATGDQSRNDQTNSSLDAVVLISDGQSNGTTNPVDILSQNADNALPIYTVAAGQDSEPIDLGILAAGISTKVRKEDLFRGTVRIKEQCPEGTRYRLLMRNGGVVVYEQSLTAVNQGIRDVAFEFAASEAFELAASRLERTQESRRAIPIDLECEIVPMNDLEELTLSNNLRMVSTWGITRENKILVLDPRGRWETRYIRNALERDPNWELVGKLGLTEFEESSFFESKESLGSFDLVIITTEAAQTLREEQTQWLSDYVSKTGGGLIWIDSARSERMLGNAWKILLPVQMGAESEIVHSSANRSVEGGLRLVGSAMDEPALKLSSDDSKGSIWDRLAGPRSALIQKAKPGCEILVEFKAVRDKDNRGQSSEDWFPLIITSRFGQGRVIAMASDETWRWRYEVADLYHQRFWNQISVWCMRTPFAVSDEYLSVDAGSRVYTTDQSVVIRAKLLDENRLPIENGNVKAVLSQSGVELARLELVEQIDSGGIYQGVFREFDSLTQSQSFDSEKEVTVHIEASGVPWEALKTKTSFRIDQSIDIESSQLACDADRLIAIAKKTQAESLRLGSLEEIEDLLSVHTRGSIHIERLSLAESYIWLGLIMTVLAVEWMLRKRFGLV
ncbi:MAG: VWA domain-containing protein [Pirellula sp.]|jgi:hypothetical protein|nr:VWA domain-containing protein [Pirellula sp.]